jgi:hypothetical protein
MKYAQFRWLRMATPPALWGTTPTHTTHAASRLGLPELLAADAALTVYVAEGEKDCDNLAALGPVTTTNAGGAEKWTAELSPYLAGRAVVILPDNDEAGHRHAEQVAESLQGIAASVRIVNLPGLPPKGDVSDWLDAHDAAEPEALRAQLVTLAAQAPVWQCPATANQHTCVESADSLSIVVDDPWPDPPAVEAYYGLAGDIVRAIEPHTESDPVALLAQFLLGFGIVIGRTADFRAEADRQ